MPPIISVVLCTHNPRLDYLSRVFAALNNQTLPLTQWEFLLIDNASVAPLATSCDLSWHPQARCIVEEKLGLTSARLCGITESRGQVIVFVDDDNLLADDYLEKVAQISAEFPYIGAFGGSIKGEFEVPPEPWTFPYLHRLAIREIERDSWSNFTNGWNEGTPYGAGLCVRSLVAQDYREKALGSSKRRALGRVGTGTGSAEDTDLAYCAIDLGMGIGTFSRLKMTHIIPKQRLTLDYIARLTAGIYASDPVLKSLRPPKALGWGPGRLAPIRFWVKFCAKLATSSKWDRTLAIAAYRGRRSGQKCVREAAGDLSAIQH